MGITSRAKLTENYSRLHDYNVSKEIQKRIL